ncbi:MAG: hypothetical protein K2K53_03425 [Oscillospiraceae bacterium]|nr:hypothetical protein [Oscillospiraceae bacterium]
MIEVKIKISEVDYGAAIDVLMPVLLDKLSSSSSPIVKILLGKLKGLSGPAAKAALDMLPQETKDELAAACLNHYSEEISKLMVNVAQQKGINVQVENVEVAVGS